MSPSPAHYCPWAEPALAERFARTANEGIVEHCAHAADRLHGLGYAPLQVAERVLEDAVGDLGLHGVEISTFEPGIDLSSPVLEGFWARADELGAIVFIHPWGCTLDERLRGSYMTNLVGQPVEHTVALSHIILSGVLDRHPGLRILAAHGGGYLPFFPARMDHGWRARPDITDPGELPSSTCGGSTSTRWSTSRRPVDARRARRHRQGPHGHGLPVRHGGRGSGRRSTPLPGWTTPRRAAIRGGTAASLLRVTV